MLCLPGDDALAQEGHQEAEAQDAHANTDDSRRPQKSALAQGRRPGLVLVACLDDEHHDDEEGQRHAEWQHLHARGGTCRCANITPHARKRVLLNCRNTIS